MEMTEQARAEMEANRRRYEALKAAGTTPKTLPDPTPPETAAIGDEDVIERLDIPGGWYATTTMKRGEALRIVNPGGDATVTLFAWRGDDTSERLNHADTVKVQWSASLRKGRVLLTDMGRVLFSITEATTFGHDALVGGSTAASTRAQFGSGGWRNTQDNLILAAGKHGLTPRDIGPTVAFFAPVAIDEDGRFGWDDSERTAGDFVDLRAEMDAIVAFSTCPHPLDPASDYAPGTATIIRHRAAKAGPDDLCRTAGEEAVRAFENTDALFAA